MYRTLFVAVLVLSFACLSGCAHDKLLRLETKDFTASAKDSEARGRAFYDDLIKNDRELWVALHQYDPNCKPHSMQPSFFRSDLSGRRLCDATPQRPEQRPAFDLKRSDFATEYAALAFIARYLTALSKAAADPELDAREDFVAAAQDLNLLLEVFRERKIEQNRIDAVGDLVGFINELAKEHHSAKEIRSIVAENRHAVDRAFGQLILVLKKDKFHENALDSAKSALAMVADTAPDGSLGAASRKKVIELHYAKEDALQRAKDCENSASKNKYPEIGIGEHDLCGFPEAGVMFAAWRSHRAFLGLIDGRMSKRQKARLIGLQRENFRRIAKLYLDIVGVF
jgi:hypothetical protein